MGVWEGLISIIVLASSLGLVAYSLGVLSAFRVHPISAALGIYVILMGSIGFVLPCFLVDNPKDINLFFPFIDWQAYQIGLAAFVYSVFSMAISILVWNRWILKYRFETFFNNADLPIPLAPSQQYYWQGLSVISLLCVCYLYFAGGSPLTLLTDTSFSAESFAILRKTASSGLPRHMQYLQRIIVVVAPACAFFFWSSYYHHRTQKLFVFSLLTTGVASLALIRTGDKAPILFFAVGLAAILQLYKPVTLRRASVFGILVVVGIFFVFGWIMGNSQLSLFTGFLYRILFGQMEGVPLSFYLFPEHYDFLGVGGGPTWLLNLLEVPRNHAYQVRAAFRYFASNPDTVGVMNTYYIGDAWAYWGIWGVVLSPWYVGSILAVTNYFIWRFRSNVESYVALAYFSMSGMGLTNDVWDFFWPSTWAFFIVLIGMSWLVGKRDKVC